MAAAILAKELGHDVFLTESQAIEKHEESVRKLDRKGIGYEFGGNSDKALENTDCIITSPGVPPTADIIIKAEKAGIPIISELEFAYNQIDNPIIAITGTNGKTTTTALTEFIFNNSGRKAIAVGNIGRPLSSVVLGLEPDVVIVAEVSSYQLDRIDKFAPDVAIITNITPDHISYHGSFENYQQAKWKISSKQIAKNLLILNADDEFASQPKINIEATLAWVSLSPLERGIFKDDGKMKIRFPEQHKTEEVMFFDELSLPGVHNAYNSMAAALAARAFEISNEDIRDSLMTFKGVEHRLEFVRTIGGVDFVNDTKATNINACWYALQSYKKPLIWIAGGRGDNNDYSALDQLVKDNVRAIIAIGEEQDAIFNHFCASSRCIKADDLEDAVIKGFSEADNGDIVLLSPSCKSFDMFMSFEHRGFEFKKIVNNLK